MATYEKQNSRQSVDQEQTEAEGYRKSFDQEQIEVENYIDNDFKEVEMAPTNEIFFVIYFLWVGGVSYLGWCVIINSLDFFNALYPAGNCNFVFPLATYSAQLIMTFLITYISNAISYKVRLYAGMIAIMIILQLVPVVALWFQGTSFGLVITWLLLLALGIFNNLIYASVAGFASQVSGKYTAYFLMGVAIFGLIQNGIKETIFLAFDHPADGNAVPIVVFCIVTNVLIFTGIVLHTLFVRTDMHNKVAGGFIESFSNLTEENQVELLKASRPIGTPRKSLKSLIECAGYTWEYLLLMMVAVIQLNMIHPGIMLKKPIPGLENQEKTVYMITCFSIFYILGKYIGKYRQSYNKTTLYIAVISRFFMFAFFIIQAVTVEIPVFNTPEFGFLNIAAFAVSMGFLNVAIFIMGPEQVSSEKKETAGFLSVFAISIGAMIGGLLALTLENIGFNSDSSAGGE